MVESVVFWQRMLTPHMTELARQVSLLGVEVHYVAEQVLSEERREMGWETGNLSGILIHYISTPKETRSLVGCFPPSAFHITQGVRSNGLIAYAQKEIAARRLHHYPIMEKVDLRGPAKWVKPFVYAQRFWALAGKIEGLLVIGEGSPEWVARWSPRSLRVIPFAYFLKGRKKRLAPRGTDKFKFIYVGGLISRKRVDLLLEALSDLSDRPFEVWIVGDGPMRRQLEQRARTVLPGRVVFQGYCGMDETIAQIAEADCLVLPSAQDGWGAVVSEAQINGTPVVCSSECGSSGTVRASGFGGVFKAGEMTSLRQSLAVMLDRGPAEDAIREKLAAWATCLSAEVGARYLLEIIGSERQSAKAILPPWERIK